MSHTNENGILVYLSGVEPDQMLLCVLLPWLCTLFVGAVAVVNSMECLDWLEDLVDRLWIPSLEAESRQPPYRGMPLVILALDKTAAGKCV